MRQSKFVNKITLPHLHILYFTVLSLLVGLSSVTAQKQQNYVQAFEQAKMDYKNGKLFKVLKLEDYAEKLPSYLQDEAYYLLFNSYVYTLQDSMALVSMQKLLRENPEINPKNEDEKFRYFYQRFQARPKEIGIMVGQNRHRGIVDASRVNKGFSLGLVHNQLLNRKLSLFTNFIYTERHQTLNSRTGRYNLPGTFIGQTDLDKSTAETYDVNPKNFPTEVYHLSGDTYPSFIEVASGLQWNIVKYKNFELFVMGGLALNYLIETTFDNGEIYFWQIEYTDDNGRLQANFPLESAISIAEAQDAEHNTPINLHYLGGVGIRYHLNDGVLFFETRMQQSTVQQEVSFKSESTAFSEIISPFKRQSLKFQTRTFTFSLGYLFRIQRFKSLRR